MLGLTIAARRRRDVGALTLACAFYFGAGGLLPIAFPKGQFANLVVLWEWICAVLSLPALAYFSLVFEGGYQSPARPRIMRVFLGLGGAIAAWVTVTGPYAFGRTLVAPQFLLTTARTALMLAGVVLCIVAFTDTWRHAEVERRQRMRWLFVGFVLLLIAFSILATVNSGAFGVTPATALTVGVVNDALVAMTLVLLAYAILRHRVIDVGFVINRALVFAVFTGLLLVSFGVLEWLVDHFVRFENRERSKLLDGIIALALFLAFHRVRYSIEALVERVFFHAWRLKEAVLNRFHETAQYFSRPDALMEAYLAAIDASAGCHGSGLYQREDSGRFSHHRGCGACRSHDSPLAVGRLPGGGQEGRAGGIPAG